MAPVVALVTMAFVVYNSKQLYTHDATGAQQCGRKMLENGQDKQLHNPRTLAAARNNI
jgi:hypothetical protein